MQLWRKPKHPDQRGSGAGVSTGDTRRGYGDGLFTAASQGVSASITERGNLDCTTLRRSRTWALMELWGGHECTVNRIQDRYGDQTLRSGHEQRLSDLELFAGLGIKRLRYPVLWERVAPDSLNAPDWRWSDERLAEIDRLGMSPIAGLLHHGSGPNYTSLVSENFVAGLAAHARAVAERYPWITDWTPVNEPLTTARFSTLYGHWYPHAVDEGAFWLALLNQIDATRHAMEEVRKVTPHARLIQTEDLCQVYGTPPLAAEVAYQNHRRWATWDLLTGRVTQTHVLWSRIARYGLSARLEAIAQAPCPPDILGVNFYPTSERFLDHRAELYPQWRPGDLGQFDMDAVRVLDPAPVGLEGLLAQAWARYGIPIAITESHLNASPDDQVRWVAEAWSCAQHLRATGADIQAVTSWALLGSYDWTSLLTREAGVYEPGAFDVSSGRAKETGLTPILRHLGHGGALKDWIAKYPTAGEPGWWRQDTRLNLPPYRWLEDQAAL